MLQAVIMIVEDNQANRELAAALLTAAGYTVLEAEDGRGLLERVKRERPALTRQLKADAETREIPVVAVTARIHPGQEAIALEAGCAVYLTKPLDFEILRKTVASLLNR